MFLLSVSEKKPNLVSDIWDKFGFFGTNHQYTRNDKDGYKKERLQVPLS